MCSYSAPYIHTYPMRVAKNAHHMGRFFVVRETHSKQVFRKSPESEDKDTLMYSITSTASVGRG